MTCLEHFLKKIKKQAHSSKQDQEGKILKPTKKPTKKTTRKQSKTQTKHSNKEKTPLPTKLEIILEELHPVTCKSVEIEIEQIYSS